MQTMFKKKTLDILKLYKVLICLSPLLFSFFIILTNNIDFNGAFESGDYIGIAKTWLGESSRNVPLERLPLYPLFISLIFKLFDSNNLHLKNKIIKVKERLKNGLPTVPTILDDEIQCNIFLKAKDLQTFSKLRDLKDNF